MAFIPLTQYLANPETYRNNPSDLGAGGSYSPTLLGETQKSLQSSLRGELPQDVQNLINQSAAQWGVATGMPGSQLAGYRGLRDLGLTSLGEIQRAQGILANKIMTPEESSRLALSQAANMTSLNNQRMQQNALNDQIRQQQNDAWLRSTGQYPGAVGGYVMNQAPRYATQNPMGYQTQPQYSGYGGYGGGVQNDVWYSGTGSSPLNYQGTYQAGSSTPDYSGTGYGLGTYESSTPYYIAAPESNYNAWSAPEEYQPFNLGYSSYEDPYAW